MKNTIILSTAILTGAVLMTYLIKRRKNKTVLPLPATPVKLHHLTNVFANAKAHNR